MVSNKLDTKKLNANIHSADIQINKVQTIMSDLKKELIKNEPDLLKVKSLLYEFRTTFRAAGTLIVDIMQQLSKITPMNTLLSEKNLKLFSNPTTFDEYEKSQLQRIDAQLKSVDKILQLMRQDPPARIEILRDILYVFVSEYETRYLIFKSTDILNDSDPLSQIKKFISLGFAGLTENWITAACYLSAIDILVNKKRYELKISNPTEKIEINTPFEQKYKELIQHMESSGKKFSEIMKPIPTAFWVIRTKVIHYGEIPSPQELDMIITSSTVVLQMLSQ